MEKDTLTQTALIQHIADNTGVSKTAVKETLDGLAQTVQQALDRGLAVSLPGIGKLSVKERAARAGRNPQTGEPIEIAARRVPSFKAAKALRDVV